MPINTQASGIISNDGSKVVSVYGERQVKVYGVHEQELDSVSMMNTGTTVFFSLGGFCLQSIVGQNFSWPVLLTSNGIATLFLLVAGLLCFFKGKSTIKTIKKAHDEPQKSPRKQ